MSSRACFFPHTRTRSLCEAWLVLLEIEILDPKAQAFGDTQNAAVEQLDHEHVATIYARQQRWTSSFESNMGTRLGRRAPTEECGTSTGSSSTWR